MAHCHPPHAPDRRPTPSRVISGQAPTTAAASPSQPRSAGPSPPRTSTPTLPAHPLPRQQPSNDPVPLHVAPWCQGKIKWG